MIRPTFTALLLWLAGSAVALACSCIEPKTPQQKREFARRIAKEAAAIAEIELAQSTRNNQAGEALYRVVKLHAGKAPAQFRLEHTSIDGEVILTSCDVEPPPGKRTLVVLYSGRAAGIYQIGGTCDYMFVNSPGAIELIRSAFRTQSA